MTGDDFSLDVNNPNEPKVLVVGNNPDRQNNYSAALGLYNSHIVKLINKKHQLKSSVIIDELPPIYFFFKIDTFDLTKSSQLLNLDELARVAKAYHLRVTVTDATDSATGTVPINNSLSASRADYIYNELVKRGVDGSRINKVSEGGIDDYKPTEANRHTKVCLYYL